MKTERKISKTNEVKEVKLPTANDVERESVSKEITDDDTLKTLKELLDTTDYEFELFRDIRNRFWVECRLKSGGEPFEIYFSDINPKNKDIKEMDGLGEFPPEMALELKEYMRLLRKSRQYTYKNPTWIAENKLLMLFIKTYKDKGFSDETYDDALIMVRRLDKVYFQHNYVVNCITNDLLNDYASMLYNEKIIVDKVANEFIKYKEFFGKPKRRYYCFSMKVLKHV